MSLTAGTRLGPYGIVAPIGAGGMGEVYRARDAKLQRDVAIELLPEVLARDPDALERFEREARADILAIHDFGTEGGLSFAVTELLEGEPLRAEAPGRRDPAEEGRQLRAADGAGLAAAHDRGIVHRDLEPENASVAPDGTLLFIERSKEGVGADLLTLSPDGKTVTPFLVPRPASKVGGQSSPDGRFVVYVSGETGRDEVDLRRFPETGDDVAVSTDGGSGPRRSPDGKEIFYRRGDAYLSASVTAAGDKPVVGAFDSDSEWIVWLKMERMFHKLNLDR